MKLANKKLVYNHKMTEEQYDEWLDIQYDLEKLVEKNLKMKGNLRYILVKADKVKRLILNYTMKKLENL